MLLMSLFVTSLNSGSNGNCYYVGNNNEAVLVDVGISCREVEARMKRLGLELNKIKAIFISHEHSDHIKGVQMLSKKHQLPVYVTDATRKNGHLKLEKHLSKTFTNSRQITIGSLEVFAFNKYHDAVDPYSFMISCSGINVGVFTDIGRSCSNLIHHFKQCHAAFLESNYDDVMLHSGKYPYYLKQRITGGLGHLSNKEALELFRTHRSSSLTHLFLSHLSKNNNCPRLVQQLFDEHAEGVKMVIASRFEETPVFHISADVNMSSKHLSKPASKSTQLQLSFI